MGTVNDYAYFHQRQAGYQISDEDADSADVDITYYGYLNQEGEWYIMREDVNVGGDDDVKAWRFAKGSSGYTANWALRESLTYADFETTFK